VKFFKRKRDEAPPADGDAGSVNAGDDTAAAITGPVGFGYKSAWLAIPTEDTQAAAEALHVIDTHPTPWAEGIHAVYRFRPWEQGRAPIFLTPAVDGWTLAVLSASKLSEDDGLEGGDLDLASLSRRFG